MLALKVAKCHRHWVRQPARLYESLVLDTRFTGEVAEPFIAGQIEFWDLEGCGFLSCLPEVFARPGS